MQFDMLKPELGGESFSGWVQTIFNGETMGDLLPQGNSGSMYQSMYIGHNMQDNKNIYILVIMCRIKMFCKNKHLVLLLNSQLGIQSLISLRYKIF